MGADAVYFYYGVKRTIPLNGEEEIEQLEDDSHPICALANKHKLQFTWGCVTDGADYFLLIGRELGCFGVEGKDELTIADGNLAETVERTKAALKAAGITDAPAIHVQLQAQY